jgi:RNA polymerase sigma factor (sigma-70 family)
MQKFTERSAEINGLSRGSVQRLSEPGLVEAAKQGHSVAFAELSERYRQKLFRVAQRITRNSEDAEDAVQDTFLRAFVHVTDFDGRSSFGTWLTRIAINSALLILRKRRPSFEIATDYNDAFGADGLRYDISDRGPNPERRYAQNEEESILKKAIQSLRPTLRVAIQIQLQECSMRETAEALDISLCATKGRLLHARAALYRSLISKLLRQPRFASPFMHCPQRGASGRTKERAQCADLRQSNHKKPGDKYVIETKHKRNLEVSSILQPRDGRDFSWERGA